MYYMVAINVELRYSKLTCLVTHLRWQRARLCPCHDPLPNFGLLKFQFKWSMTHDWNVDPMNALNFYEGRLQLGLFLILFYL